MSEATTADAGDWRDRADELHDEMGVPTVRARVVALRERGLTYAAIADELGLSGRHETGTHVQEYRKQRERSERLLADGPEI